MSNRWSKNQSVGDCKTCICRLGHQKKSPTSESSDDEVGNGSDELRDSQMPSQLLDTLKNMREDDSLCDVRLRVDNSFVRIPAHKVVLAAASPYFRKMFSCGLKESQNGEAHFHEIQAEVLVAVVNFIYTGKVKIDEQHVDGILDAADLFQLPSLRNLCLWWLHNNFTPSNCLGTYVMALLRSHLDLAESAKLYALDHFREVCEGEEFLQLSPEHLYTFLSSPYLACDNEGILIKSVLEWIAYNLEKRKPYLEWLIEKINLQEIGPQTLIEIIQNPVLANQSHLEKRIRETLTDTLSKKFENIDQLETSYYQSTTSRCYHQQEVILAIGGESQGQSLSNVECFMMGYDGWKCSIPKPSSAAIPEETDMVIIPTMKQCRSYSAVTYSNYSIYVIGGQDCGFPLNIVEKYDILGNRWEGLCPLPLSVHGCGAAFVNSKLYLVGGRSSKQHEKRVWVYDENEDSWTEGTPMKYYRSHLSVAGFNGELYATGGIGGTNDTEDNFLNTVEKFDPLTRSWSQLTPMHEHRAFHCATVVDGCIYTLGGCNGKMWLRTVERYDTMCGQWSKVSNMSIPRSSFGVTSINGRIYCVGGYDGVHYLNTVEKYNPRTDRWHCCHAMQIDRYGLAVAMLPLPMKSHVNERDLS